MIRSILCFLALLFVVASCYYLPTWVEHYRERIVASGVRAGLELAKMPDVETKVEP